MVQIRLACGAEILVNLLALEDLDAEIGQTGQDGLDLFGATLELAEQLTDMASVEVAVLATLSEQLLKLRREILSISDELLILSKLGQGSRALPRAGRHLRPRRG